MENGLYQEVPSNNIPLTPQWSPIQPSMYSLSHLVHPEMALVSNPQIPNCSPSIQHMSPPSLGHVWPPAHHPPNSFTSIVRADNMTVEQTAEWVRTLGRFNMWEEADEYANSFTINGIWGYLLQKLTIEALKEELGIIKYGHRLEIMLAIGYLFPSVVVSNNQLESKVGQREEIQSPMVQSVADAVSVEGNASPVQIDRSPSLASTMAWTPDNKALEGGEVDGMGTSAFLKQHKLLKPKEHKKEVMKWVGSMAGPHTLVNASFPKLLPYTPRNSSGRAGPTNPTIYKTLRKVKMRSGKSGHAKPIGYLPKGSVVVINQIKGRSGRVVFQDENGGFTKAGWVTLYTQDKQQLLRKYNPKTNLSGFTVSSLAGVTTE